MLLLKKLSLNRDITRIRFFSNANLNILLLTVSNDLTKHDKRKWLSSYVGSLWQELNETLKLTFNAKSSIIFKTFII